MSHAASQGRYRGYRCRQCGSFPKARSCWRCSRPIAVLLPAPGFAHQGHGPARLGREGDILQGIALAGVAEADVVELYPAPDRVQRPRTGLVAHGGLDVQHIEKLHQAGGIHEQAVHKPYHLVHAADEMRRKPHEGDDLAHRRFALQVEPGAHGENANDRDGRDRALKDTHHRPPVEHRELGGEQALDLLAHHAQLRRQSHKALHQHHVADGISRPFRQVAATRLHLPWAVRVRRVT